MKKEIVYASVFVWGLAVVSGGVYVFAFWFWKLRLRNNICIILGLSNSRFVSEFEQMYLLLIISVNCVLLCLLCVCSLHIFLKAYQSHKSLVSATGKNSSQSRVGKL